MSLAVESAIPEASSEARSLRPGKGKFEISLRDGKRSFALVGAVRSLDIAPGGPAGRRHPEGKGVLPCRGHPGEVRRDPQSGDFAGSVCAAVASRKECGSVGYLGAVGSASSRTTASMQRGRRGHSRERK